MNQEVVKDVLVDLDSLTPECFQVIFKEPMPNRIVCFTRKHSPFPMYVNHRLLPFWRRVEWVVVPRFVEHVSEYLMGYLRNMPYRSQIKEWIQEQKEWKQIQSMCNFVSQSKPEEHELCIYTNRPRAFQVCEKLEGTSYHAVNFVSFKRGDASETEEED